MGIFISALLWNSSRLYTLSIIQRCKGLRQSNASRKELWSRLQDSNDSYFWFTANTGRPLLLSRDCCACGCAHTLLFLLWLYIRLPVYSTAGTLIFGIALGSLLRGALSLRTFAANWPTIAQVVNWERVDEYLAASTAKPQRFQLRLSTLIVLVIAAAVMVGLNATPGKGTDVNPIFTTTWKTYGFPFPFLYTDYAVVPSANPPAAMAAATPSAAKLQEMYQSESSWGMDSLVLDIMLWLGCLLLLKRYWEQFQERKRAHPAPAGTLPSSSSVQMKTDEQETSNSSP